MRLILPIPDWVFLLMVLALTVFLGRWLLIKGYNSQQKKEGKTISITQRKRAKLYFKQFIAALVLFILLLTAAYKYL